MDLRRAPILLILLSALLILYGPALGYGAGPARAMLGPAPEGPAITAGCSGERWPVKIGGDKDIHLVSLDAHITSISRLRALHAPKTLPTDRRVRPTETTIWALSAVLIRFKRQPNQDYRLVLEDSKHRTLIAEAVAPQCVSPSNPLLPFIQGVRSLINTRLPVRKTYTATSMRAEIAGIGFFDPGHASSDAAPNGIQLHPLLSLSLTSNGTSSSSSTATDTPTVTPTGTVTPTPTITPTPTSTSNGPPPLPIPGKSRATPTDTAVPGENAGSDTTDTPTPTDTPVDNGSVTGTPTDTPVPTDTPFPTDTPLPTDTPTITTTPTDTPVPTNTPTITPTPTMTPTFTPTATATPNGIAVSASAPASAKQFTNVTVTGTITKNGEPYRNVPATFTWHYPGRLATHACAEGTNLFTGAGGTVQCTENVLSTNAGSTVTVDVTFTDPVTFAQYTAHTSFTVTAGPELAGASRLGWW